MRMACRAVLCAAVVWSTGLGPSHALAQVDLAGLSAPDARAGKQKPDSAPWQLSARYDERRISIRLHDVALKDALSAISEAGKVVLFYNDRDIPAAKRLSVSVDDMPVGEVLRIALQGTRLAARVTSAGIVLEVRRETTPLGSASDTTGSISGSVTDSTTGEAIAGATVAIAGADRSAVTGNDGRYRLEGLDAGTHTVIVRRLGYRESSRRISVRTPVDQVLDIKLASVPLTLDQIVTTATGEQRRLEVGNLIASVDVDSLTSTLPVNNLGQVLGGRVAGVQVFFSGGLTGASPQISIRGQNSLSLSGQPLLVIDGVRIENTAASNITGPTYAAVSSGRFNDIPLGDIESIEVVKGPSAATLYGTDAANGVILIKTKRGAPGALRLKAFAEEGLLTFDRNRFKPSLYPWGHLLDGTSGQTRCALLSVLAGVCAEDSITSFSPLRDPETTPLGSGHRMAYGLQASGGDAVRYFLSGSYEDEVGYLKMPGADAQLLREERGGRPLTDEEMRPNAARKYGLRANVTVPVTPSASLLVSSAIVRLNSRIPSTVTLLRGAASSGVRDENDGWLFGIRPGDDFVKRHREQVTHFIGSVAGSWRPTSWLEARLSTGLDFAGSYLDELARAGEGFLPGTIAGARSNSKTNTTTETIDGGISATLPITTTITSRSSIGVQYTRRALLTNTAAAEQLAVGTETVGGGAVPIVRESTLESVVAGSYFEETVALHDRLFITGAVRVDGSSSFGKGFHAAVYPKASASWVLSREPFWPGIPGVNSFRLRAAYGQSGVQPGAVAALATENLSPVFVDGAAVVGAGLGSVGNRDLRPERQREFEAGFDAELFRGRLALSATYYDKRSTDALVNLSLPASFGGGTRWENVASVANWGYEASVRADVVARRSLHWSVQFNGSINDNKVLEIGPGVTAQYGAVTPGIVRDQPLFSYFDYPILGFDDANNDGLLDASEVTIGDARQFAGRAYPRTQLSTSTTVGLFGDRLALSATVDHRGGLAKLNYVAVNECVFDACPSSVDPRASLASQAATVAAKSGRPQSTFWGFVEDASFTRLREVSLNYELSSSLASVAHARSARLVFAGRNVALWSQYSGPDPEVQTQFGASDAGAYFDAGGLPPATYWIVRLELGF